MNHHLFDHVNILDGKHHSPNGLELDVKKEVTRYTELIRSFNGIDMQLPDRP